MSLGESVTVYPSFPFGDLSAPGALLRPPAMSFANGGYWGCDINPVTEHPVDVARPAQRDVIYQPSLL